MNRSIWNVALAMAAAWLLQGCNSSKPPAPPPVVQPSAPVAGTAGNDRQLVTPAVYRPESFASKPYVEPDVKAAVADYTVQPGFANIGNWYQFKNSFDADEQEMLRKNLFLVLMANRHQMSYIYEENSYAQNEKLAWMPSFITTDAVLHTYHVYFDYVLRTVEQNRLAPAASELTKALITGALAQYGAAADDAVKTAALHNLAYLLIPAKALMVDLKGLKIPADAGALADSEWSLIEAHSGAVQSPITGALVDYTQFIPRGHYTRSDALKQYFIAMIWYGSVPILVRDKTGKALPDGMRQAALLGELFDPSSKTGPDVVRTWNAIMDTTSFLVGSSDDFSPQQLLAAVKPAAGSKAPEAAAGTDADLAAMVAAAEKASPTQMVNGKRAQEIAVKLMGQRFVLDGYVMQNLLLPYVGTDEKPRNQPKGLDVLAALGNERAKDLLLTDYKQNQFDNYESQLTKMTNYISAMDPQTWTANAYYGWLDVLRQEVAKKPDGYPSVMRNDAWMDKSLNAALGSWAELRHDTVLYSKQSAVEMGGGDEDIANPPPGGYVEPDIRVYARLRFLLDELTGGLGKQKMMEESFTQTSKMFGDVLDRLIEISKRELTNQPLTKDQDDWTREFGDLMDGLNVFMAESRVKQGGQTITETNFDTDRDMAVIADVNTDVKNGMVLEEGSGHANVIYAVFPARGKLWIGRGAVYSYYEFEHAAADRLTDEAWKKMLRDKPVAGQPDWISSFEIQKASKDCRSTPADDDRKDAARSHDYGA